MVVVPVIAMTSQRLSGGLGVRRVYVWVLPKALLKVLVNGGLTGGETVVVSVTVSTSELAQNVKFVLFSRSITAHCNSHNSTNFGTLLEHVFVRSSCNRFIFLVSGCRDPRRSSPRSTMLRS
jgi:hypothetical protein